MEPPEYRTCKTCNVVKNKQLDFTKHKAVCKSCVNRAQKLRKDENRRKVIDYLLEKGCFICNNRNVFCLQFHHLDPSTKNHNVSDIMGRNWSIIEKEIALCQVLCGNCHAIKTAKEQGWHKRII